MVIKHFNDATVKQLRVEVEAAINDIAKKYGLKASTLGRISYNSISLSTGKLNFALEAEQPDLTSMKLEDFISKRFKHGSRTFTIIGTEDGKLLARTNRGARYLLRVDQLSTMISF